jgi:hypothetical protein
VLTCVECTCPVPLDQELLQLLLVLLSGRERHGWWFWWQHSYWASTVCRFPLEIVRLDAWLVDGCVRTGPLDPGHPAEAHIGGHLGELFADDAEVGKGIPADEHLCQLLHDVQHVPGCGSASISALNGDDDGHSS